MSADAMQTRTRAASTRARRAATLVSRTTNAAREEAATGPLDQSALMHLLGYSTALAAVATRKRFVRQIGTLGLRTVEFSILVLVDSNVEVNQKRLGETLDISPSNLAVVLDRMAEHGWVRRERSERDRRAHLIRLTAQGESLVRKALKLSRTAEDDLDTVLSPAERAMLIELLHRVIRARVPHARDTEHDMSSND